jgi:hypothetical protein
VGEGNKSASLPSLIPKREGDINLQIASLVVYQGV